MAKGGAQQGDDGQQGHDGQILEQQDADRPLAAGRRQVAALLQHLHDDGCGGHDEAHGSDEGHRRRNPRRHGDAGQGQPRQPDLGRAQTENLLAHPPQALGPHLQADDEQEDDHAELSDVQDDFRLAEQGQAEGTDGDARRQIAEHRAQPDLAEYRHGHHARRQEGRYMAQFQSRCSLGHRSPLRLSFHSGGEHDRLRGGRFGGVASWRRPEPRTPCAGFSSWAARRPLHERRP